MRVVVADDEPLARRVIRDLLTRYEDVTVVGECRSGTEAVEVLRATAPDLLFLDIQMPELDGFGVLRAVLPACPPAVVLVTAYDEFAVQAFEAEALDFLVKPFTDERFHQAVGRARRRLALEEASRMSRALAGLLERVGPGGGAAIAEPPARRTRLLVTAGARTIAVPVSGIRWIEAEDYYARIHTDRGSYLLRESLGALERELDPAAFLRVHRSALVHTGSIREVRRHPAGRCVVVLTDGTRLPVSDRRRGAVLRRLGG